MLSLSKTGMPCSGPRTGRFDVLRRGHRRWPRVRVDLDHGMEGRAGRVKIGDAAQVPLVRPRAVRSPAAIFCWREKSSGSACEATPVDSEHQVASRPHDTTAWRCLARVEEAAILARRAGASGHLMYVRAGFQPKQNEGRRHGQNPGLRGHRRCGDHRAGRQPGRPVGEVYGDGEALHGEAAAGRTRLCRAGRSQGGGDQALWDAGTTRVALLENLRRMEIDPATITGIALSHGHHDHIAAMTDVLQAMRPGAVPRKWEAGATPAEMARWAEGNTCRWWPTRSFPRALASGRGRHEVWPRAGTAAEAVGSSGGQGGVV